MNSIGITRDEWLQALAFEEEDPDAKTVNELAAEMKVSRHSIYRRIQALVEEGRATKHWKRAPVGSSKGRLVPAYKLVKAPHATRVAARHR